MPGPGKPTPQGVSASLDAISQAKGSILLRTADGWSYLEAGPDGARLTANGPGQLPGWGASIYSPQTLALLAAMDVKPSTARKGHINTLIASLIATEAWNKADVIYVLAAHDEQAARLNWKDPAVRTITAVNAPTFTVDRGFTGNGTSQQLLPGVDLDQLGGYSRDDAHLAVWSLTAGSLTSAECGCSVATYAHIISQYVNGQSYGRLNGPNYTIVASAAGDGFHLMNRVGQYDLRHYRNNVQVAFNGQTSAAIPANCALEYLSDTGDALYCARQLAAASAGRAFTSDERAALYAALTVYLNELGAI